MEAWSFVLRAMLLMHGHKLGQIRPSPSANRPPVKTAPTLAYAKRWVVGVAKRRWASRLHTRLSHECSRSVDAVKAFKLDDMRVDDVPRPIRKWERDGKAVASILHLMVDQHCGDSSQQADTQAVTVAHAGFPRLPAHLQLVELVKKYASLLQGGGVTRVTEAFIDSFDRVNPGQAGRCGGRRRWARILRRRWGRRWHRVEREGTPLAVVARALRWHNLLASIADWLLTKHNALARWFV